MLTFLFGCMVGGFTGIVAMCIFAVSGQQSRLEEIRDKEQEMR